MRLETPGLKRILILLFSLLPASLTWLSCGGYTAPGGGMGTGLKYRAFITNGVSAGSEASGIYILNAQKDVIGAASPISAGATPGIMVVTPNRAQTVVFSGSGTLGSDNQLSLINNASESDATHVTLPGTTESFVVSPDSSSVYVAVPTAQVIGQPPGVVDAISLSSGTVTGQVNVPAVHYLSTDNGGNRIFGFSDNSDFVSVITPSQINIGTAVTTIGGPGIFDRPVAAFFSTDDNTAFVVSCGAECGGTQAGVQQFNLVTNTLVASVPACVPIAGSNPVQCASNSPAAASIALVSGSTMYLAGTPYSPGGGPSLPCTAGTTQTQAQFCGQLTVLDLNTMSVTNSAPIVITDGYHNRIGMGANGQLFIGARTCTEIVPPLPPPVGAETRGCLSIYNSLPTTTVGSNPPGGVLIPPETGEVTGIEPIATRSVVYVVQGQAVQGGTLYIYDTTIDALEDNPNDPNNPGRVSGLVGNFVDIKTIDF
jgi:hypothetical protein